VVHSTHQTEDVAALCERDAGLVALTGFAVGAAAVVWISLIAGCLAWLSIPSGVVAPGPALVPSGAVLPISETAAYRREA
jgi:hypothetical protein